MHERTIQDASPSDTPLLQPPATWIVLVFFGLTAGYWFFHLPEFAHMWREDLVVYARAVQTWQTGGNPYNAALAPLFFLYPPVFLYIAGFFSHLIPAGWGSFAYTALHVATTVGLPLILARFYFRKPWLGVGFALLLFFASPRFMGILALCTLNIASTLYCMAFAAAVPGLRRGRWGWFYAAIFVAAMIKITFLALLLLPLLVGRRQWWKSIGCGAAVVGANLLEMKLAPYLYSGYKWSLAQGIMKEGAYGFGIFGAVSAYGYKLHIPAIGAYVAAVTLALALVCLMLVLRRRLERFGNMRRLGDLGSNGVWLAMVVATTIMVNPRQLQYDVDICLFAAFLLWVYALRTKRLVVLMVALFVPSLLMLFVVKAPHLRGMYGTFEVLVAFGLGYWRLWREAEPESEGAPSVERAGFPEHVELSAVAGD